MPADLVNREGLEALEDQILASYAVHSSSSLGRRHPESAHRYRTCFQRDRDRVIHSSAFRRLEYKTQVFVNSEGDYYRTRLTHTLETAQIARTLARTLRLNEDLVEAAALSHDLGHTPFGHAGQDVMNELMRDHGGFEHNLQSLRIVDELERRYPEFPGLNLCVETREAIAKHSPREAGGFPAGWPTLEGQLVDIIDSVAYLAADLDDGLHSGILEFEALADIQLVQMAIDRVCDRSPKLDPRTLRRPLISAVIDILVGDFVTETTKRLAGAGVSSVEDIRGAEGPLAGFSEEIGRLKARTHVFLQKSFYSHWRVRRMAVRARSILHNLFRVYTENPDILPPQHQANCETYGVPRAVCDYIAGMTDRFAVDEAARLNVADRSS